MSQLTQKPQPLWQATILPSIICAFFTAVFKAMDNYTVHHIATAPDGMTAAFAYLIVGGWVGVTSGLIFALAFGKKLLDKDFNGLIFRNKEMHKQAFISGAISAGSTLFFLWGNQLGDPSTLIALGTLTIVFTTTYDVFRGKLTLGKIILPMTLVVVGGAMSSYTGSVYITVMGFLLVAILSNGLRAYSEFVEQRGAKASDGVNMFLWRFFWLCTTGTVLGLVVTGMYGTTAMLITTMTKIWASLWWIIITMFFVFLGVGMNTTIKKTAVVSIVVLVMSLQMVFSYPLTIIGNAIYPGAFGELPTDLAIWAVRILGAMLMIAGIFLLTKKNPKVTT